MYGHLGQSVVWPPGPDSVVRPPRPNPSSVWPVGLSVVWPPRPDPSSVWPLGLILYGHLGRFLYSHLAELVDVWPPRPIDCTAT